MTSKIVYEGALRTTATHLRSGSVIETDAPTDNNGKGERFSPTDLVATALGSCMMTIMGIVARQRQLPLENTRISIEKVMGTDPRRITEVKVKIDFPPDLDLSPEERTRLEQAALNCPVAKSIHPDIRQSVVFNWHPAEEATVHE
ncbi:OsmC family protein [Compostibacter hankyongensis]|uniref:OsmC family protein n=1 Tax=Compostibacter hankyongensis TaxID=1007089 RepID=A0ABP8FVQ7_9BACT